MGDASSTTDTLDRPPAEWRERDEAGVERWRKLGVLQSQHPEGRRFEPLSCPRCRCARVLVLDISYQGWMNGNSEGTAVYVCLECEAYTRYSYRD